MTSILTGLVDTFSSDALSFCCDLKSNVQNATHTTSGNNKGKNISSDCCTKSATTPINPKRNPTPLSSGIEAPLSIFWSSMIFTAILEVYDSMFFQNCTFSLEYARSPSIWRNSWIEILRILLPFFVTFQSLFAIYSTKSILSFQSWFHWCDEFVWMHQALNP